MSFSPRTYYWTTQAFVWLDMLVAATLFTQERYAFALLIALCAAIMQLAAAICWQEIQHGDF